MTKKNHPDKPAPPAGHDRKKQAGPGRKKAEALSAALRANLARRKQQARARNVSPSPAKETE